MTENTDAHDWDDELKDLVDGVLEDSEEDVPEDVVDLPAQAEQPGGSPDKDTAELLAERTADLQRLQAEYVNYKRRVDRDRNVAYQRGVEAVLAELLPVLDGIEAARAHGELTGGAAMLADEVAKVAAKHGLVSFGEEGDPFNPHIHEALMAVDKPGYSVPSVAQVFQKGYSIGDKILRPARVGVAEAELEPGPDQPSEGQGDPACGRMTGDDGRMTGDDGRMTGDDGRMAGDDGTAAEDGKMTGEETLAGGGAAGAEGPTE